MIFLNKNIKLALIIISILLFLMILFIINDKGIYSNGKVENYNNELVNNIKITNIIAIKYNYKMPSNSDGYTDLIGVEYQLFFEKSRGWYSL